MIDKTNNQFGKYNGNEYKYVLEALDSENKNRFNFVEKFENAFREKMKSKYLIILNKYANNRSHLLMFF